METTSYGSCAGGSEALASIMNKLPDSNNELLKLVAASSMIAGPNGTPVGNEALNFNNSTAVGLASIPDGATHALVTPQGDAINFRIDGGDPTATLVGHHASDNDNFIVTQLENLRVIGQTTTGTLFVTYF